MLISLSYLDTNCSCSFVDARGHIFLVTAVLIAQKKSSWTDFVSALVETHFAPTVGKGTNLCQCSPAVFEAHVSTLSRSINTGRLESATPLFMNR